MQGTKLNHLSFDRRQNLASKLFSGVNFFIFLLSLLVIVTTVLPLPAYHCSLCPVMRTFYEFGIIWNAGIIEAIEVERSDVTELDANALLDVRRTVRENCCQLGTNGASISCDWRSAFRCAGDRYYVSSGAAVGALFCPKGLMLWVSR